MPDDHRAEDDRRDHHPDQLDEAVAERLDLVGESRPKATDHDADHDGDQHLDVEHLVPGLPPGDRGFRHNLAAQGRGCRRFCPVGPAYVASIGTSPSGARCGPSSRHCQPAARAPFSGHFPCREDRCPLSPSASGCSSPASSTSSARASVLPRSSSWRMPAARSRCRAAQTCCGQPAYNSGDRSGCPGDRAAGDRAFEGFDYVVAPSGSCAGMLRAHYPELFADDPRMPVARAASRGQATYELVSFLVDVLGVTGVAARYRGTRHLSRFPARGCASSASRPQPRRLLRSVAGLDAQGAARRRDLLRLRRHLLRQISGDLRPDGDRQGGRHRGDRRRHAARRRSRLPPQHGRQAAAGAAQACASAMSPRCWPA